MPVGFQKILMYITRRARGAPTPNKSTPAESSRQRDSVQNHGVASRISTLDGAVGAVDATDGRLH
eukprot:516001-Rhodomonas_salina.1